MTRGFFSQRAFEVRSIDFVKGFAILLIFGHHWARTILEVNEQPRPTLLQWHFVEPLGNFTLFFQAIKNTDILTVIEQGLGHWGYMGVNMFLVASGFGLAYGAVNPTKDWSRFMARRLRKIMPAFFCVVLTFGLLQYAVGIHDTLLQTMKAIITKASFLFFWDKRLFFNDNSPLWFIGLILPLYCCFPLLYQHAEKSDRWYFIVKLLIFSSLVKFVLQSPAIMNWHPYLFHGFFLARLPEFYFGVMLGYLCRRDGKFPVSIAQLGIFVSVSCLIVVAAHLHPIVYILLDPSLAVFSFCSALIIYKLSKRINLFNTRLISWIGVMSFSVYLIHRPIITMAYQTQIFDAVSGFTVVLESVLLLLIVLCIAWGMDLLFRRTGVFPAASKHLAY